MATALDRVFAEMDEKLASMREGDTLHDYDVDAITFKTDLTTGILTGFSRVGNFNKNTQRGISPTPKIQKRRGLTINDRQYMNIKKSMQNERMSKWTQIEDKLLVDAIRSQLEQGNQYTKWKYYATNVFLGMKTAVQCRDRWDLVLNPSITRRGKWSSRETIDLLISLNDTPASEHGARFVRASMYLNGSRTPISCRDRWNTLRAAVQSRTNVLSSIVTPEYVLNIIQKK